jgi:hypothetical protein
MADDDAVRRPSIDFIRKKWGSLGDLPKHVIPVVWVTSYRSIETAMKAEAVGGPRGLLKNSLIGDRQLTQQLEEATIKIKILERMISLLRSTPSEWARSVDGHVLVDLLKWGIIDAGSMSGLRRTLMRQFAKADQEYKKPVPPQVSF